MHENCTGFDSPIHKHLFLNSPPPDVEKTPTIQLESAPKSVSYSNLYRIIGPKGILDLLVGYMRVSSDSDRQTTDLQRDALLAAGVDERHLFEDKASGAPSDRSGLVAALDYVRSGDGLVVWKLDRLGRSLPHLLEIVTGLEDRQVGFRSLTEHMDTTTPQDAFLFSVFGALTQYERALARERTWPGRKLRGDAGEGAAARGRLIPRNWRRSFQRLSMAPARLQCAGISE